jgi:N-acetyl-alpha-D-muramate 1-phosphate uridylyltransferase
VQAVVLAGGLATRMRPHTLTIPKSMLEVSGRPFVDHQLELLAKHGYTDVLLCIGHLGEQVEAHVGDGARFGLRVAYAHDGPKLLGTWGALRATLDRLEIDFLVTYGDSWLPFDYSAPLATLRAHDDCDGVMSVFENQGQWDTSNVVSDGTWVTRYEKGVKDAAFRFIDYGALALRKDAVARLPAGETAGLDRLQHELAKEGRMRAVVAQDRFFEIGSPEGLAALEQRLGR